MLTTINTEGVVNHGLISGRVRHAATAGWNEEGNQSEARDGPRQGSRCLPKWCCTSSSSAARGFASKAVSSADGHSRLVRAVQLKFVGQRKASH